MFGLFTPSCPVETAEKAWIERRMRWLADRFGIERMRDATVILPTDAFFPDHYEPNEATCQKYLDYICKQMRVDPATLTLTIVPDEVIPGAAGVYQRGSKPTPTTRRVRSTVLVATSQLANPMSLIATLAHEVGHEILLGGEHLTDAVEDHEQITDLLTVFLGVGVFNANSTVHESSWREGNISGWSMGRQGYLSAVAFGYAFGVFAYVRGEVYPEWPAHLRPDARGAMQKGLRYLSKTHDSLFRPDHVRSESPPTVSQVLEGLAHRSATFRLGALCEVEWSGVDGPEVIAGVCRCLNDRDTAVQNAAARALSRFGEAAQPAIPKLLELVRTESPVWLNAIWTLASIKADASLVLPEVTSLIRAYPAEAGHLASVAKSYGSAALVTLPALLDALRRHFSHGIGDHQNVLALIHDLSPNPEALLREYFADDPELRQLALWDYRQLTG